MVMINSEGTLFDTRVEMQSSESTSFMTQPDPPSTTSPDVDLLWQLPAVYSNVRPSVLLFIDPAVADYATLVGGVKAGVEVIVLNPTLDGVEEITEFLMRRQGVTAVHIVSHGSPGRLFLGTSQLSLATLNGYAPLLRNWFHQHPDRPQFPPPHLLLYGCRAACDYVGLEFVHSLHYLTGAEVNASTTPTGHPDLGGDWNLDVTTSGAVLPLVFRLDTLQTYAGVFFRNC